MKVKEKTHYCPILDKQIDEANCLEIKGIVGGEMIDVGGTGDGDYSKIYEVEKLWWDLPIWLPRIKFATWKKEKMFF